MRARVSHAKQSVWTTCLELHCGRDEHCMCRGENLFPWKLTKGTREMHVCTTHPSNADRSQYEDGAI